jgi:hypothetical protein
MHAPHDESESAPREQQKPESTSFLLILLVIIALVLIGVSIFLDEMPALP